jgi:hypothetical protein
MKRIFKFKWKYYDYRPQKIMFQIIKRGKFKELPDKYIWKYFFGYLYPWKDNCPILEDNIVHDEYEDDDWYTDNEDYYDWDWIDVDSYHYSNIYIKEMKWVKIIDRFPREWDDWDWPDQSLCFGWTWVMYDACDYDYVNSNHDY